MSVSKCQWRGLLGAACSTRKAQNYLSWVAPHTGRTISGWACQRHTDELLLSADKEDFEITVESVSGGSLPVQTTMADKALSDALHCPVYAPSGHSATGLSDGGVP